MYGGNFVVGFGGPSQPQNQPQGFGNMNNMMMNQMQQMHQMQRQMMSMHINHRHQKGNFNNYGQQTDFNPSQFQQKDFQLQDISDNDIKSLCDYMNKAPNDAARILTLQDACNRFSFESHEVAMALDTFDNDLTRLNALEIFAKRINSMNNPEKILDLFTGTTRGLAKERLQVFVPGTKIVDEKVEKSKTIGSSSQNYGGQQQQQQQQGTGNITINMNTSQGSNKSGNSGQYSQGSQNYGGNQQQQQYNQGGQQQYNQGGQQQYNQGQQYNQQGQYNQGGQQQYNQGGQQQYNQGQQYNQQGQFNQGGQVQFPQQGGNTQYGQQGYPQQ